MKTLYYPSADATLITTINYTGTVISSPIIIAGKDILLATAIYGKPLEEVIAGKLRKNLKTV